MRVGVRTPLKATEDPAKVAAAVQALFPDLPLQEADGWLAGTTDDVRPLRKRVWELRIIDTVRGQVLHGAPRMEATATRFRLSKQAALANKVSFPPSPHPLGDIEVTIDLDGDDPWTTVEAFAAWLCPETKDGEIVGPILP